MRRIAIHELIKKVAFGRFEHESKPKIDMGIFTKALLKIIDDHAQRQGISTREAIKAVYDVGMQKYRWA